MQLHQVLKMLPPPNHLEDTHSLFRCVFFLQFFEDILANSSNSLLNFMFKVFQYSWFIAVEPFFKKSPEDGVTCREVWGRWRPNAHPTMWSPRKFCRTAVEWFWGVPFPVSVQTIWWGKFSQKHNYKYMSKWWRLLAMEKKYMFRPIAAVFRFWQLSC